MLTVERVREIAEREIRKYCSDEDEPYLVTVEQVRGQPRLIGIHWDVANPESDGRFRSRSTAVDISQSEEMVRYRIKAAFAFPPNLCSLYEQPDIGIVDHPTEPPPDEVSKEAGCD